MRWCVEQSDLLIVLFDRAIRCHRVLRVSQSVSVLLDQKNENTENITVAPNLNQ